MVFFYSILKDMYKEVKYAIQLDGGETPLFTSQVGVKQGCILNPYLFSIYMNDLTQLFDASCDPPILQDRKISCLLYADDMVLLSESADGLQKCLDKLQIYCDNWNLHVNIDKTKVMIFNKSGRILKTNKFIYGGKPLEYTNEYKYLGIIFKPSGSFTFAVEQLCRKARKAIFSIRKTLYSENMNIAPHLKLFDSCVKPILLYCSEIWSLDFLTREKAELESRCMLFYLLKYS